MPLVPTVQGRQVESRGVSNPGFQTVDQPNIGNAILGAGEQALNVFGEAKQKANVAMAQNASLKLSQTEEELKTQLYGLQGQNALGKGHEFTQKYNEQIQALSDSLPDDASRQMFMQQARLQQIQFQGNVNRYEIGQVNSFENEQINATRKLQIKKEADAWDNPQEAALAKNIRTVSIARYGAARGWSQEQMLAEIEKDNQEATELRAKNYAVANPIGWLGGNFSSEDTGELDMRAVGLVESGGKHRNADGSLVTSPAGAQGEFQLMPDTGKELAAKRGLEYNPEDPEQHAQLARDYAGQLSKKYQSETLAGAAYNWGMGNVDKLISKIGDPRKGDISIEDFVKQLPSETQGWLSRYKKNTTGMDPLSIYKIDNIAHSQIEKQRSLVLKELEPTYNNTMAQLNNGEVPDSIPSIPSIMFGFGEQGKKMVTQLDIAMDNAKTFQAIQYLPPTEQKAELEKVKPQVNDPDYALKFDAYGKLNALVARSNETIQSMKDSNRFNEALAIGEKLDPSNKSMQKAADNTPSALNFRINDANTHDAIVQQVNQTGIIPTQVTSQLNAISRSSSPEVVKQGANLFNSLYETDPASVGDMPKDMQSFYLTVKQLTDSGMASDEAVKQAQNVTYNQSDALKSQLSSTQSTKEYKKERASAMDSAVSSMKPWYSFGGPAADDQNVNAVNFRNDYQSLYDINYRNSGGNADVAKKMTNTQIARTWSLSDVNGSAQFMKYAPEALYNYGPSGWQASQWKEEKERLTYGEREENISTSPTQLGITSGSAPVIKSNTPESRIGGELEITPDVLTTHNGDYAIMVRMKDKDGIESVQPYYDKYGRPMRWKPSLEDWKPYQDMQKESEIKGQQEIIRGQEIRNFKDKHRAMDEQYRKFHNDRVNRFKNYFSWDAE
ncbi:transglycosylase SLT domain-containing protein [Klebsiella michiganensis]|uniref:transglycosylase SLT domain-containing protein n=1 Tax=Klebsiella michiganensis TaxID=1134687 RepID=UPI0018D49E70|nr:transglycosylase SLT domain-containing protein [Klebsiella michiganensis]HBM3105869.1 transglycosylase SLT domain-containing protein [Klebsiella oxytoca]QPQ12494.1 transglycosylase SLT domain-containing protein [Klebsiella michiganensis]UPI88693.1 transglycosylase SLT domain-containing protein [Klebsiella michiganensis]HBM2960886.1 transglycosylase SLT domain-containing protein [Klebsiella michiganensis]HDX8821738.1 transglycosylase SLT domain-containing protein [Klebsiella michiganensis]